MAKAAAKTKKTIPAPAGWPGPSEIWPLDRIRPYPNNARTHPPAEIELLAKLLKRFGPDQDIVVDEKEEILKGHGRLEAARMAELPGFPVTQRFGMSDHDKIAMRLQDNVLPLMAGWDNKLVQFEIETLKRGGYDIAMLGFGEHQLVQFTTTPGPPAGGFQTFGADIETHHECPRCHYRWSGSSAPPPEPELKPDAKKKNAAAAKKKSK